MARGKRVNINDLFEDITPDGVAAIPEDFVPVQGMPEKKEDKVQIEQKEDESKNVKENIKQNKKEKQEKTASSNQTEEKAKFTMVLDKELWDDFLILAQIRGLKQVDALSDVLYRETKKNRTAIDKAKEHLSYIKNLAKGL